MEHGICQKNMSNILSELGLDESDNIKWFDLALCLGMENEQFFDKYESDINVAKNIDEACMSCPVISLCYESGVDGSEYGVWGGVYLSSGSVDKTRNAHKSKEVWKRLKGLHA